MARCQQVQIEYLFFQGQIKDFLVGVADTIGHQMYINIL